VIAKAKQQTDERQDITASVVQSPQVTPSLNGKCHEWIAGIGIYGNGLGKRTYQPGIVANFPQQTFLLFYRFS